jgi:hypothetical protein
MRRNRAGQLRGNIISPFFTSTPDQEAAPPGFPLFGPKIKAYVAALHQQKVKPAQTDCGGTSIT